MDWLKRIKERLAQAEKKSYLAKELGASRFNIDQYLKYFRQNPVASFVRKN
jgi:hypothetical protein